MACDGTTKVWELRTRELLRLDGARGARVRATRGTVWLTLEDDPRDIVLGTGDAFTIDRGGLTLVEAQSDTTLCVDARYVDAVRVGPTPPALAARFAGWVASVGAAGERRAAPYY